MTTLEGYHPRGQGKQEIPCKLPFPNAVGVCSVCYQAPHSLYQQRTVIELHGVPTAVFPYWGWAVSVVRLAPCASLSGTMMPLASHCWWEWATAALCTLPRGSAATIQRGPDAAFCSAPGVLSHGIACHHWAAQYSSRILPFSCSHGFGHPALLRLSCGCSLPVPWSQRQDWDPPSTGCAIAATTVCATTVSPHPGATNRCGESQGLRPWLAEDVHMPTLRHW